MFVTILLKLLIVASNLLDIAPRLDLWSLIFAIAPSSISIAASAPVTVPRVTEDRALKDAVFEAVLSKKPSPSVTSSVEIVNDSEELNLKPPDD